MSNIVGIVMGSDSDYPYVVETMKVLKRFHVSFEVSVISAHRDTQRAFSYASSARERNLDIIIAFAGMAAHLAGVLASNTTLPVIGVPLDRTSFGGRDALLSTLQMPPGIPVATVGVDSGANAAWLALRILSLHNPELQKQLEEEKENTKQKLLEKTQKVREMWDHES
ncbi:MAG: 5-(carboxyamino)imidazole ribonucleotide mutase [Caldisericia bacterium]|nr:5-(carboxyamino)imidazole ribonucleotide mutase [Caldisericia bacterium]MDD4614061.1 5-(carboxyamino)imidazole ribonucleotide mutase [Caldisericia bacterium]